MSTELDVIEYVLGLDALRVGVGQAAENARQRSLLKIRTMKLRQRALQARAFALGSPALYVRGPDEAQSARLDQEALTIECEIEAEWARCLEELKILFLSSGAAPLAEVA